MEHFSGISSGTMFYSYCIVLLLLLLSVVKPDVEHAEHGFSGKFRKEHDADGDGDKHNVHADHQAFLGSKKEAEAFDDLSPEEAKRRLAILAKKMDSDEDGYITYQELAAVIRKNIMALDVDEADERFREMDTNHDNFVTWEEFVVEAFGDIDPADENFDADDKSLMEDDKKFFAAADEDKDGKLSITEFHSFQNPESYSHMHDVLIEVTMAEKDKNRDGKISLDEFLGETAKDKESDLYTNEKNRFEHEYDSDRNGFLEGPEIASWLVMSLDNIVDEETQHLMKNADKNGDTRLTIDEIVEKSDLFVGSEATNHGESLVDMAHDEL